MNRSASDHPSWQQWYDALKQILPVYLSTHIAFLLLTYLSVLFTVGNFTKNRLGLIVLLQSWNRWDTAQFTAIAAHGYDGSWRTAFFPLYPLLETILAWLVRDPFIAGLLLSNIATAGLLMVLYRLIKEDFGEAPAERGTLYLALFPTAFFLAAAYNESLFLCLVLCSFYQIRWGRWWWAGIFGLLAALTRSAGLLLLVPFGYEYLRQHNFQWKTLLRPQLLSSLLIPAGTALFGLYCALRFHDALAFSHAQAYWGRQLALPGLGFARTLWVIITYGPLSFPSIHGVIDLSAGLLMLLLTLLCFAGPWRFSPHLRSYALYAAATWLFLIAFPSRDVPLQSLARQSIEVFPAFIVLAGMGKHARFHLYYLVISGALLSFLLLQFLTGYWTV
ncbi:MAG: hypothetical protein IMW89_11370 [Ktedonobacteraceae bacterium]|nr:hypothetical protein [Ktedonobacteraceae bacterium]